MLSLPLRWFKVHDELEVLRSAAPFELIEVVETRNMYVLKAKECCPSDIKRFKDYLKKAGFKRLSKRVVVICESSIHF